MGFLIFMCSLLVAAYVLDKCQQHSKDLGLLFDAVVIGSGGLLGLIVYCAYRMLKVSFLQ